MSTVSLGMPAVVESALWEAALFEERGFTDLNISVKHHDPLAMVAAYPMLVARCDCPLHLGSPRPTRGCRAR
jgi:(E)-4-hydroxy-3-methylbut-2-enyl-diphosphate synthase